MRVRRKWSAVNTTHRPHSTGWWLLRKHQIHFLLTTHSTGPLLHNPIQLVFFWPIQLVPFCTIQNWFLYLYQIDCSVFVAPLNWAILSSHSTGPFLLPHLTGPFFVSPFNWSFFGILFNWSLYWYQFNCSLFVVPFKWSIFLSHSTGPFLILHSTSPFHLPFSTGPFLITPFNWSFCPFYLVIGIAFVTPFKFSILYTSQLVPFLLLNFACPFFAPCNWSLFVIEHS